MHCSMHQPCHLTPPNPSPMNTVIYAPRHAPIPCDPPCFQSHEHFGMYPTPWIMHLTMPPIVWTVQYASHHSPNPMNTDMHTHHHAPNPLQATNPLNTATCTPRLDNAYHHILNPLQPVTQSLHAHYAPNPEHYTMHQIPWICIPPYLRSPEHCSMPSPCHQFPDERCNTHGTMASIPLNTAKCIPPFP